jgi:hypothetical protein
VELHGSRIVAFHPAALMRVSRCCLALTLPL